MSLRSIFSAAAIVIASSCGGFACAAPQENDKVLYHVVEMDPLILNNALVSGGANGHIFQIKMSSSTTSRGDILTAAASFDGLIIGSSDIDYSDIPDVDLSSLEVFTEQGDAVKIILEMRFGVENDCFFNDDGRSRLRLLFNQGQPVERYVITYDTCEPVVRPLE